jgi:hypothetical protein
MNASHRFFFFYYERVLHIYAEYMQEKKISQSMFG